MKKECRFGIYIAPIIGLIVLLVGGLFFLNVSDENLTGRVITGLESRFEFDYDGADSIEVTAPIKDGTATFNLFYGNYCNSHYTKY